MTAISGNKGVKRRPRRGSAKLPEVQAAIMDAVEDGMDSAPEVRAALIERFGVGNVPSERTVRDMINEAKLIEFEPWSLADVRPEDAAILVPMLTELVDKSGMVAPISKGRAKWMVLLRRAAPGMPATLTAYLAMMYLGRTAFAEPTADLDGFLAAGPWRSKQATATYLRACAEEKIRPLGGVDYWSDQPDGLDDLDDAEWTPDVAPPLGGGERVEE